MSSVARSIDQETRPIIIASIEPEGSVETRVDLQPLIKGLSFEDLEKKADKLSLTVDNFDGSAFDTEIFAKGNIIHWAWGYPGFMSPRRSVVIDETTGGIELTITAKSLSVLMHRRSVMQTYDSATRSEIVTAIAERNGFGASRRTIAATTEVFESVVQPNISDARMISNLAHREGFEFFVDHTGLHWGPRGFDKAPTRRFIWYGGQARNKEAIIDYQVQNDLTAKPAKITVKGIDPDSKQLIDETGSNSDTERTTLQPVVELRDFETGEWQRQERAASEEVRPTSEPTAAAAKAQADGRFRKVSQVTVKLSITVIGDPLLLAKTVCEIEGIAKRIDGRYYIQKVVTNVSSGAKQTLTMITDGSRGTQGVSLNDALFSPDRATGTGDPFDVALRMLSVIGDVTLELIINSAAAGAAGLPVSSINDKLARIDQRLTENPNDEAAYREAQTIGNTLAKHPQPLKGLGRSLTRSAKRGISSVQNANTDGTLNTQPFVEDDRALQAVVRDSETQEWIPKT